MLNRLMKKVESRKEEKRLNKEQGYYEYLFNSDEYKRYEERNKENKVKEVKTNNEKAVNREEKEREKMLEYCKRIHAEFNKQENKEVKEDNKPAEKINVHTDREAYLKMIYDEYFANKENKEEPVVNTKAENKPAEENKTKTKGKGRVYKKVVNDKVVEEQEKVNNEPEEEIDEIEFLARIAYGETDYYTCDEYDYDEYEEGYYVDGYNNFFNNTNNNEEECHIDGYDNNNFFNNDNNDEDNDNTQYKYLE